VPEETRLDRELIELLNELRVALPGVQVLFAFLLAVPVSSRFEGVTELQRDTYMLALLATAIGSALLIAPTAYHRIQFRQRDKERMIQTANRLALGGLACLGVAMTAAVFLVTDFIVSIPAAALASGALALTFVWFWWGLPLRRKLSD
jgi:hypothetical protein